MKEYHKENKEKIEQYIKTHDNINPFEVSKVLRYVIRNQLIFLYNHSKKELFLISSTLQKKGRI